MNRKNIIVGLSVAIETMIIASLCSGNGEMVSVRNANRIEKAFSGLDNHPPANLVVRSCNVDADCNPGMAHPDRFTSFCRNEDGGTFQPGFDGPVGGSGGSCSQ